MTLRLWLVRHAQSTWNAEGRLQGKADPPLTDEGRRQAASVAFLFNDTATTEIYTSPLQRAGETARIIGEQTNLEPIEESRLQEIGVGVGSSYRWEELLEAWPHLERVAQRGDLVLPYIPGAESLPAFGKRVAEGFARIWRAEGSGDVIVVSHGGVFRAYLSQILNIEQGFTPMLHFGNASVSQVSFRAPGWTDVHFINDMSHLRNGND